MRQQRKPLILDETTAKLPGLSPVENKVLRAGIGPACSGSTLPLIAACGRECVSGGFVRRVGRGILIAEGPRAKLVDARNLTQIIALYARP